MDEAGRGAFAGPLCVAGVVYPPDFLAPKILPKGIIVRDSKKMSEKQRLRAHGWILDNCLDCFIVFISAKKIDRYGIAAVSQIGFGLVAQGLYRHHYANAVLMIDGIRIGQDHPLLKYVEQKVLVRGEDKSFSIASASILAKVERDNLMKNMHQIYPDYSFDKNKGYGTGEHIEAIKILGLSPIHRKSFTVKI